MHSVISNVISINIMAKANIETSTGMKISVEGTADEIAAIVAHVKSGDKVIKSKRPLVEKKQRRSENTSITLVSLILKLKESGFFNKPQKIAQVKEALAQQTHHYPLESISTALIRRVKKGELGRVKDGKIWAYVKR